MVGGFAHRGTPVCEQAEAGVGARSQDVVELETGARVDLGPEKSLGAVDVPVQPKLEIGVGKTSLAKDVAPRSASGSEVLRRHAEPSCQELDRLQRGVTPAGLDPRDMRERDSRPGDVAQRQSLLDPQPPHALADRLLGGPHRGANVDGGLRLGQWAFLSGDKAPPMVGPIHAATRGRGCGMPIPGDYIWP